MIGWGAIWTGLKIIGLLFTIFYRPSFKSSSEKPNPNQLRVQTSEKGGVVPVIYGTRRIAGNLIWYDNFQTHEHYQEAETGGKGGGSTEQVFSHYSYTASFAFGVCMGEADTLKIWQGKDEIPSADWASRGITIYRGTQDQTADSHIASFVDRAPAYKNLCYVVFENFNLGQMAFLPMFTFEVSTYDVLYIGDYYNSRIHVLDRYGNYKRKWGSSGGDPGEFVYGVYKAVGYEGEILTGGADWIQAFGLDGTFKRRWGGASLMWYDLDVYENEVYAVENGVNNYVIVTDLDGVNQRNIGDSGAHALVSPQSIKVRHNNVYVLDRVAASSFYMKVWTTNNVFVKEWSLGNLGETGPPNFYGLDISDDDEIYVSDKTNDCIKVTDLDGVLQRELGSSGSGEGEFNDPSGLNIRNKKLYVADFGNDRIQILDLQGNFLYEIGSEGSGNGELNGPNGIVVYNNGAKGDLTPPLIASDMLMNDLYSLGMSVSNLDISSFSSTENYCNANDLLISMLIDGKISMLDLLGNLTSYHNGYVVCENRKIAYKQIKTEDNVTIVNVATDVLSKDPPVDMNRESFRDVRNKVIITYTKRDDAYSSGVVVAEDEIHQQKNGIKEVSFDMPAFCSGDRAMKIAYTILRRIIEMPMRYSFSVGPKKATTLVPGAVFGLTDTQLGISEKPLRVIDTSENDDGTIQIEAVEEITFLLDDKSAPSDDYYIPPVRLGDPGNVRYPTIVELPPLISGDKNIVIVSFASSTQESWFGATVYDSFDDATYAQKEASTGECLMGEVNSITDDSITVTITDSDESLNNKADVFELLQDLNFNTCYDKTQDSFFRFAKATLISGAQWKLEGIIWNCYSIPTLTHSASISDIISFMKYKQMPIDLEYDIARKGNTIYYKIPSYNYAGTAQDLADISAESISFNAKGTAPIAPMNLEVDGLGTITKITSGDIKINWETCNRKDRGLDYERSDQITEDTDFVRFDIKVIDADTDTTLRTTTTTDSDWTYTSVMQTEDGNKTNLKFEVEKVSETNRSETSELTIQIV